MRTVFQRPESTDWMLSGACVGLGVELFHGPDGETARMRARREAQAKTVCARCRVRDLCLADAMTADDYAGDSVWGGTTQDERRALGGRVPDVERHKREREASPQLAAAFALVRDGGTWGTVVDALRVSPEEADRLVRRARAHLDAIARVERARTGSRPDHMVDATGSRRRLQALMCGGWGPRQMAGRLGVSYDMVLRIVSGRTRAVSKSVARSVRELYEECAGRVPGPGERSPKAATVARQRGYLPSSAWAGVDMDDATVAPRVAA